MQWLGDLSDRLGSQKEHIEKWHTFFSKRVIFLLKEEDQLVQMINSDLKSLIIVFLKYIISQQFK